MIVKTDKNIYINVETTFEKDHYKTSAYSLEGETLGYASFHKLKEDEVWLYQVATYENYRNNGIGSVLLDMVSYWSAVLNCNHIAGKFSPSSEHVEEFYAKNGYDIVQKEYYLRLEKTIEKDNTIKDIQNKYKAIPTISQNKTAEIKKIVNNNTSQLKVL